MIKTENYKNDQQSLIKKGLEYSSQQHKYLSKQRMSNYTHNNVTISDCNESLIPENLISQI